MDQDIDLLYAMLYESRLDLMYLPSGAVAWLFDRPESQVDAASHLGVMAHQNDNPVTNATLLRADNNVLVLTTKAGQSFKVYPDGGYGLDGRPLTPEDLQMEIQNLPDHEMMGEPQPAMDPTDDDYDINYGDAGAEAPEMLADPTPNGGLSMDDLLFDQKT